MQPKKTDNAQNELFMNRLSNQLDMRDNLIKLSGRLPWGYYESEFGQHYTERKGSPGKPIRLMVGLLLLQHQKGLSDEEVVTMWKQNPYWQYFCGYDYLQWACPINPSSLTRFRKRIGTEGLEKILSSTVEVAFTVGAIKKRDCHKVLVDSTVMEKNIAHPTDGKLLNRSIERLVKLSRKHGVVLKQSYVRVAKLAMQKAQRYAHAKQYKRMRQMNRRLKTYLGRLSRDIERKIADTDLMPLFAAELAKASRLRQQQRTDKNKLYSLHEPEAVCIAKGKNHKPYEFGCKVSVVLTHKQGFVLASNAHTGNPYDGHTLKPMLDKAQSRAPVLIKQAFVDRGYKGHGVTDVDVFISGQKRGMTRALKKALKRRSAIEPHIGHMKADGKLGRNYLKGAFGDAANAILSGIGHNMRLLLAWLFCAWIIRTFLTPFRLKK